MLAKVAHAADSREKHRQELKDLLAAVTEALDSFGRVLNSDTPPGRESVRLIEQQLQRALQQAGAAPIGSVGEVPDPETHTIIDTRPGAAGAQTDTVLQVLRQGCRHQGTVLWPAEVIVAVPPSAGATSTGPAGPDDTDPTATGEEQE
jgi:molecular chaperone GrpE (heat shock protein)